MSETFYKAFSEKIDAAKKVLNRPLTLAEKILYAPQNRLSEKYLQNLFETIYKDKKVLGTDSIPEDKITQYRQELESFGLSEQHFNW